MICLPICLRVKYGKKLFLDDNKITEWKPKLRYKNRCAITIDEYIAVVILYYHVNNDFCRF